jgi:hypothetical protein
MVCFRTILGFIVSKEGKTPNPKKIEVLIKMLVPKSPREIQMFNGMGQFYRCFIHFFVSIMALITKLLKKTKVFMHMSLGGKLYLQRPLGFNKWQ